MNPAFIMRPSGFMMTSSMSAMPMPCVTPPWICPSTACGLMARPTSWHAMWRSTRTSPVSVSTSTCEMCDANR